MAKYYCILFDADNTLLDFDAAETKALTETLEHFSIPAEAATMETYRKVNAELWANLEKGEFSREKLLAERFPRFLRQAGITADGAEMGRYYLDRLATHADVLPDTLEALDELAEVATLAVISNGVERVQKQRLQDSGVANYMEEIFISEKLGCEKPNRRFFDTALRTLGIEDRRRVLVVGDSLTGDIQGGANAGLATCWFHPGSEETPAALTPTYVVHQLSQLYPIVMEEDELANVGNKNRKHSL
ncbi:MAG: YjjG family noncanonical pyrimidine nucleotidase [Faecalibacterium sp.]|jgi:YjjG family noncanonical pyrimidine nucleotidase|nr:YjjG family noncanonical pyrimidine nucleotidase [Faecalibacterium sp.]